MSKDNDYALETLVQERDLLIEKIGVKKSEMKHYNQASDEELEAWEKYVRELKAGIARLNGEKGGGNGDGRGKRRDGPIASPAKCENGRSTWWCFKRCEKYQDRSCTLIKFRAKKKAADASN